MNNEQRDEEIEDLKKRVAALEEKGKPVEAENVQHEDSQPGQ